MQISPRRWQTEALAIWKENCRGVVSVVTGGGKTAFAEMCILHFRDIHPDCAILIVVPTTALLDQWYVSLVEDLSVQKEAIACFSGEEKPTKMQDVNIIVINTARVASQELAKKRKSFLIVDECHRAGSQQNALALKGHFAATLGLSATPEREYDIGFQQHVVPVLGNIIYTYDYRMAAKDGVIVPFELINVRVKLLSDERQKYTHLTQQAAKESRMLEAGKGNQEKLKRILQQRSAVSSKAAMRIPVAVKLAEGARGQRTLIFHERIDGADSIARMLSQRKHSVTEYHSRIGPYIRRDNLRLYRRGIFDVLVSCHALDEGLNVPETTLAIIACSTASSRQRIQRLGRVLRPFQGKQSATIYTIYATDTEERRLKREESHLEGVTEVTWVEAGYN